MNHAQFWGEDARIFYLDQLSFGFFKALITPYAGYINAVPRLVAAFAAPWPTVCAPYIFNAMAFVIAAACCSAFALPAFRSIIESDSLRITSCILAATALYSEEIVGTITNIQWFLMLPAVLMTFVHFGAMGKSQRRWAALGLALIGLLITCSTPLPLILAPFLFWRLLKDKAITKTIPAAMLAGIVLETAQAIHSQPAGLGIRHFPLNQVTTAVAISGAYRVILCSIIGSSGAEWVSTHELSSVVLLTLIAAVSALTLFFWGSDQKRRTIAIVGLYLAIASISLALYGRHIYPNFQTLVNVGDWRGERYFFVAGCVFILLIGIALESSRIIRDGLTRTLTLFILFSGGFATNFRLPPVPDFHWPAEARQFDNWERSVSLGGPAAGALLPINPGGPWAILLPCRSVNALNVSQLEGCLISSGHNNPIYFVENGKKRPIANTAWVQGENEVRWPDDINVVPSSELDAIPVGDPL